MIRQPFRTGEPRMYPNEFSRMLSVERERELAELAVRAWTHETPRISCGRSG
jgi:hypothetical protein